MFEISDEKYEEIKAKAEEGDADALNDYAYCYWEKYEYPKSNKASISDKCFRLLLKSFKKNPLGNAATNLAVYLRWVGWFSEAMKWAQVGMLAEDENVKKRASKEYYEMMFRGALNLQKDDIPPSLKAKLSFLKDSNMLMDVIGGV